MSRSEGMCTFWISTANFSSFCVSLQRREPAANRYYSISYSVSLVLQCFLPCFIFYVASLERPHPT